MCLCRFFAVLFPVIIFVLHFTKPKEEDEKEVEVAEVEVYIMQSLTILSPDHPHGLHPHHYDAAGDLFSKSNQTLC